MGFQNINGFERWREISTGLIYYLVDEYDHYCSIMKPQTRRIEIVRARVLKRVFLRKFEPVKSEEKNG
jgi:hypothetical protein